MPDTNGTNAEATDLTCPQCGSEAVIAVTFILPGSQTEEGWVCEEEDCWANWRDEDDEVSSVPDYAVGNEMQYTDGRQTWWAVAREVV